MISYLTRSSYLIFYGSAIGFIIEAITSFKYTVPIYFFFEFKTSTSLILFEIMTLAASSSFVSFVIVNIEEVSFERELRLEDISQIREEIENLRSESRDEKLSEEARKNKRLQLEDRLIEMQEVQKELRDFETLRKKQIDEQNKRMQKGLLDEIQAEIIKYGDENGYDVIIDRSAKSSLGTEIVLFVGLRSDVTAFILQRLNKGYNNFTE